MQAMLEYDWPGNVRELENAIKRLTILCENEVVGISDLPEHIQENVGIIQPMGHFSSTQGLRLEGAVKDYEKRLIIEALEKSNWVKTRAAKLLNIKRTTLVEKIKKQNITRASSG